ncbi:hypothetical protein JANAI62_20540 [Jannaschia pagri]|uniref:Uncharacterized protein n=1 Tax=Jannaschia pagri TaxID=2829797 RepID=A0ABQ4NM53_9RHOB|nr:MULTISPECIES: hypothetical protein [unclassified Jannaschia]GIT91597.1 hypothetical protein JANAI61_20550 [Jannaschia sp. AI_61]GIT95431.1 hypothetical protein JANAI62_20540 [Jannaschia sp. AI_62]
MSDPFKGTLFWRPSEAERASLRGHLMAELPAGHILWTHRDTLAVEGRDQTGDRLAVTSADPSVPAAVVQMTWTGRPGMAPFLPETEVYASVPAMIEALLEEAQ